MRNLEKDELEMAGRRELMLQTGFAMFAEKGIEAVSMQDVARAWSVGIATLYRYFNTNMEAYCPSTISGADSEPFRYIGYFVGGQNVSNGSESRTLRNNVTLTTHIPRLRMILSLKVESCLLRYSRSLSWREDGTRTFVLNDKSNLLDFDTSASIYDGDGYAVVFPDYYVSYDDPGTQVPFLEKFRWAKENDAALYSDLAKLVGTSNYVYTFGKDYISPYFSANVSVTKELGDLASISFYANNFLNNMGQVLSSKTGTYSSVTSYIPTFYYGLTLRLKF